MRNPANVLRPPGHAQLSGNWSIARGLARNQEKYKLHLTECVGPRRGDLDGRSKAPPIVSK